MSRPTRAALAEPASAEAAETTSAGHPTPQGGPAGRVPRLHGNEPDLTETTHHRSEPVADQAARLVQETTTFAHDAEIGLRDTPAPLFRLLVLACLLAAPVQHTIAIRASRALRPLTRTPATLAAAEPEDVARALTLAGYWRFHHTKAALLVRAGEDVVERCSGDLRQLYRAAESPADLHRELRQIPGVGSHAAHIVLREAQAVWPDVAPYLDDRVLTGAKQLGLPDHPDQLAALVDPQDLPRLAAACVRKTLGPPVH